MAINIRDLRSAGTRPSSAPVLRNLSEARQLGRKHVFLCHSHIDVDLARGLVTLLAEFGWRAYIDWADSSMPDVPNGVTAQKIKDKIASCSYLLFLATPNSTKSRWCPWEIGYSDGKKGHESVLIVPTTDGATTFGNEYLQLYRQVDVSQFGNWYVKRPADIGIGVTLMEL